ncbi:MAG: hypothetical protein GX259_04415 [Bacteroidales bacterium]|nr:hypothetical protein [Bacteroidales bacterium]
MTDFKKQLIEEKQAKRKGGLYHKTQVSLAYNSNSIEGSRLTEEQTRYIFETRTIGFKEEEALLRLRVLDDVNINIHFLRNVLFSYPDEFIEKSHGSGLKNVASVDTLKEIKILVPPLSEQQRIVEEIETYEAAIAQAKAVMGSVQIGKKAVLEKWLG